mmetsp:Transcript_77526/g.161114  ORF Transcript_77526/g.161114 Transcript_77526/m.161114 type:complete len:204 (+) Transcript_77526:617-1228(+)
MTREILRLLTHHPLQQRKVPCYRWTLQLQDSALLHGCCYCCCCCCCCFLPSVPGTVAAFLLVLQARLLQVQLPAALLRLLPWRLLRLGCRPQGDFPSTPRFPWLCTAPGTASPAPHMCAGSRPRSPPASARSSHTCSSSALPLPEHEPLRPQWRPPGSNLGAPWPRLIVRLAWSDLQDRRCTRPRPAEVACPPTSQTTPDGFG